jgi:predicted membrane channel-forming protein YqfA (hemolysin III family)
MTSALIYGAVLIGLFSVSTIFHIIACIGNYKSVQFFTLTVNHPVV